MSLADIQSMKALKLAKQAIGNIFNSGTVTEGVVVNNGDGTLLTNASYRTSDYIPVTEDTMYFFSYVRSIAFYNSSKVFIANSGASFTTPRKNFQMRSPYNGAYVRVSAQTAFMNSSYVVTLLKMPTKWTSKFWTSYGDSITGQFMWQPYVRDYLGLIAFNNGVGGTTVADITGADTTAMCRDERINAISSSSTLITFMGGTNDWAQNVPLGAITDTGTNTFYGAVKKTLEKLVTKFPTARIIAMTTPFAKYPNRSGWSNTYGLLNNLNLTTADYGKVIIEVARLYGIPVVDVFGEAGWNDINITTYITNEGYFLHPNDLGGQRIAELVIGKLKNTELVF